MQAVTGIEYGILLLGDREGGGFQVGEPLGFRDFLAEDNGIYLLQTHVGYAVLFGEGLQLNIVLGLEVLNAVQYREVVFE